MEVASTNARVAEYLAYYGEWLYLERSIVRDIGTEGLNRVQMIDKWLAEKDSNVGPDSYDAGEHIYIGYLIHVMLHRKHGSHEQYAPFVSGGRRVKSENTGTHMLNWGRWV